MLHILLFIEGDHFPVLLVNKLIVAFLLFPGLHRLDHPLLELEGFGIRTAVQSELEAFFALPEFLRGKPEGFPSSFGKAFLVLVVVVGVIRGPCGGVAVLVEQKLGEIAVLEGVLETSGLFVVDGDNASSEGMDEPFGL